MWNSAASKPTKFYDKILMRTKEFDKMASGPKQAGNIQK
jgi:hypothetical protein